MEDAHAVLGFVEELDLEEGNARVGKPPLRTSMNRPESPNPNGFGVSLPSDDTEVDDVLGLQERRMEADEYARVSMYATRSRPPLDAIPEVR